MSVGQLLVSVMALMLLPFAVGLLGSRRWPGSAHRVGEVARQVSTLAFVVVVVMLVWVAAVDRRGSVGAEVVAASVLLTLVALAAGTLLSTATSVTRTTVGVLAPIRSGGPVLAAVAIGFGSDPVIQASVVVIALTILSITTPLAIVLGRRRSTLDPGLGVEAAAA